ncbi:corrinoid protein [bacterium]|nr:corrinoid protein [bacterium]
MALLQEISEYIQQGDMNEVSKLTSMALQQNFNPQEIIDNGLIVGMSAIGERFKRNEVFVPEMLIAARAMNKALEILEPKMVNAKIKKTGTLVIGTVEGDLHDIGKNLIGIMFKGAGFNVIDLGIDVSAERFLESAVDHKADFVGISALLTTTMVNMEKTIKELRANNITTKVLVGGAPLTEKFAHEIGADGYAPDAASAVGVAKSLMNSR